MLLRPPGPGGRSNPCPSLLQACAGKISSLGQVGATLIDCIIDIIIARKVACLAWQAVDVHVAHLQCLTAQGFEVRGCSRVQLPTNTTSLEQHMRRRNTASRRAAQPCF